MAAKHPGRKVLLAHVGARVGSKSSSNLLNSGTCHVNHKLPTQSSSSRSHNARLSTLPCGETLEFQSLREWVWKRWRPSRPGRWHTPKSSQLSFQVPPRLVINVSFNSFFFLADAPMSDSHDAKSLNLSWADSSCSLLW